MAQLREKAEKVRILWQMLESLLWSEKFLCAGKVNKIQRLILSLFMGLASCWGKRIICRVFNWVLQTSLLPFILPDWGVKKTSPFLKHIKVLFRASTKGSENKYPKFGLNFMYYILMFIIRRNGKCISALKFWFNSDLVTFLKYCFTNEYNFFTFRNG